MESEPLESCPVCGSDSCNVPNSYEGTVNCHGAACCYGIWTVEEHNTFARHAAIGALVERIATEAVGVTIMDLRATLGGCHAETMAVHCERDTLLDALRSLAAELEVSGE